MTNHIVHACTDHIVYMTTLIQPSSAAAEKVFSLLATATKRVLLSTTFKPLVMPVMIGIMGGVWEHYGALWVVCGSIMGSVWEH